MRLVSVNVGQPREVETPRGVVLTSIFKTPVSGRIVARGHNLEGDRQADLTVHGGPSKAIYVYPAEHYPHWKAELGGMELVFGHFGENLTTEGFHEEAVHIGDRYRMGSVIVEVTQPRMPCFKLALRFGLPDMVKRFWQSGRSGIYLAIVEEGELGSGDAVEQISADPNRVSVADVVRLFKGTSNDADLFERAMKTPLRGGWKTGIQERWG
jgi:MOSC domain-containing protein YiiM